MRRVGTFIFGRPRPLSGDRRAEPNYTLDPEEPQNALFNADCNAHDVCYLAEGDASRSRAQCDSEFRNAMNATCTRTYVSTDIEHKRCIGTASYYYWMVRAFGAPYFKG